MFLTPRLSIGGAALALACTPPDEPHAGDPNEVDGGTYPTGPTDTDPTEPTAAGWPQLPALDAAIEAVMDERPIPGLGACLIVDGDVAWCNGYGFADIEAGRPVTPDTPFLTASVSKTVVAIALARVAQDGLLDLDAPISDVLPYDVVHPAAPDVPITARMLAAHVSGIRDNWNVMDPLYVQGSDCPVALEGFLEAYFTPGGEYHSEERNFYGDGPLAANRYSNIGAALGAMVVQSVTGTPFDAWTDDVIFAPLGMDGATWFLADSDPATLAVPYASRQGALHPIGHFGFVDWPSGQLRASAVDMARLLAAFMTDGGGVLDPSTNAAQREAQFPEIDESQGLLWFRWTFDGAEVWGHDGSEFGSATEIVARLDDGIGAVVLMNAEENLASLREVERALFAAAADL